MKQKKIVLDQKEILLVEIELNSNWFKFFKKNELLYETKEGEWKTLKLLDGEYSFLKKAIFLDEWDWALIIEPTNYISEDPPYVNYTETHKWYRSPIESGKSLLRHHGFNMETTLVVK